MNEPAPKRNTTVAVRLPDKDYDWLVLESAKTGKRFSEILRILINEAIFTRLVK